MLVYKRVNKEIFVFIRAKQMTLYKHYLGTREFVSVFPIGEEIEYEEGIVLLGEQAACGDKLAELTLQIAKDVFVS